MKLSISYKRLALIAGFLFIALFVASESVRNLGTIIFDPWECMKILIHLN